MGFFNDCLVKETRLVKGIRDEGETVRGRETGVSCCSPSQLQMSQTFIVYIVHCHIDAVAIYT